MENKSISNACNKRNLLEKPENFSGARHTSFQVVKSLNEVVVVCPLSS